MCYIFDSFVYNKVRTRKRVFVLSDGNNFSLGRKHFSSWEEIAFLRDVFGMRSGWACFGRASQKDSFCISKGLLFLGKRPPLGVQKGSF